MLASRDRTNRSRDISKLIYLAKANDDLVSHCECGGDALITFPPQMDCPWCGCGWLFGCLNCRKAFTFAVGVETDESWETLARRDFADYPGEQPTDEQVAQWVAAMRELTAGIEPGREYVYLDGLIVAADTEALRFHGWHAEHDLDFVPHVAARRDGAIIESILANVDYWTTNALPEDKP